MPRWKAVIVLRHVGRTQETTIWLSRRTTMKSFLRERWWIHLALTHTQHQVWRREGAVFRPLASTAALSRGRILQLGPVAFVIWECLWWAVPWNIVINYIRGRPVTASDQLLNFVVWMYGHPFKSVLHHLSFLFLWHCRTHSGPEKYSSSIYFILCILL